MIKIFLIALLLLGSPGARGQYAPPLKHLYITSGYGYRVHPVTAKFSLHTGIDLRARNDTVFAIADGLVAATGYREFLGIYIRLEHNGLQSVYGHLSQVWVSCGDTVISGQPIAVSGATGRVTGEHLHFSVLYLGKPIDPIKFLYILLKYNNHE